MHILSNRNREEFLATPALCRVAMAEGSDGLEPTLLIKTNTIYLKALALGVRFSFVLKLRPEDNLLVYGIEIYFDNESPVIIWSIADNSEEIVALERFLKGKCWSIFLFNEIVLNVLGSVPVYFKEVKNRDISIHDAVIGFEISGEKQDEITEKFPETNLDSNEYWDIRFELADKVEWYQTKNIYISNGLYKSEIRVLNENEGGQQEQLALWLTDELSLEGVAINPEIGKKDDRRELCDLFFGYEFGVFLIESKSISIFSREELPSAEKIRRNLARHVKKAIRQLGGACRKIKSGDSLYFQGTEISSFDSEKPPHCIVLIDDLHELNEVPSINIDDIVQFSEKYGGMLHFLDLSDILRLIQGAHFYLEKGEYSLLHYFDYLLMERWKKTIEARKPVINMLIHRE